MLHPQCCRHCCGTIMAEEEREEDADTSEEVATDPSVSVEVCSFQTFVFYLVIGDGHCWSYHMKLREPF